MDWEREKEDREVCEHVFHEKLWVEGAQVEVYRMGMKVRGSERPLIVCMSA